LAAWDKIEWHNLVVKTLPSGQADIEVVSGGQAVKVKVHFDDSRSEGSETAIQKTYALVVGL
jgi:hypothetical protein